MHLVDGYAQLISMWPVVASPYNRLLHMSFLFYIVPYLYSYFKNQNNNDDGSQSLESAVVEAWNRVIQQPSIIFRRAVVGINCNVDVIVQGTALLDRMNVTPGQARDHESLHNADDLQTAFAHSFRHGQGAERYLSDQETFDRAIRVAEQLEDYRGYLQYHIGGNAALMAQKIASSFPRTAAVLVGPIGPRSQALLHPSVIKTNSTRISRDELHIIMEYKQGEIWGEHISPASSRFITSHDTFSGSAVVIDMFFKTIGQYKPDLVILSGVHLLEFQPKEMRLEKLRLIKRNLLQINGNIPIHLELGSMADAAYANQVLHRIIPNVDSIAFNEQELAFLSHIGDGPYTDQYPVTAGTMHVHKAVEMLFWLLTNFGQDKTDADSKNAQYRLQRIHFRCLTYHVMVSRGTDWSNLAAALAAGARLAGRQACNIQNQVDTDMLELRTSTSYLLDKEVGKVYHFQSHNPIASWMRSGALFLYTPVLVCKFPTKTVGLDDAISATGLIYSQFYKLGGSRNVMRW